MIERIVSAIRAAVIGHGFSWFERGDYNLNLVGVRSESRKPGSFDDLLICIYKVGGAWTLHLWPITTDPGTRYLERPINPAGAAILAHPQQILGGYKIGLHRGRDALVQAERMRVWRDGNRDDVLDWGEGLMEGWYGINMHDTPHSTNHGASAGCQVFAQRDELKALLDLVERTGGRVTYTIIGEESLGL